MLLCVNGKRYKSEVIIHVKINQMDARDTFQSTYMTPPRKSMPSPSVHNFSVGFLLFLKTHLYLRNNLGMLLEVVGF